jgi:hypothetical protein
MAAGGDQLPSAQMNKALITAEGVERRWRRRKRAT